MMIPEGAISCACHAGEIKKSGEKKKGKENINAGSSLGEKNGVEEKERDG